MIPLSVVVEAKKHGYGLTQLQDMVRLSARCTHPAGNRRYEDVLFMVEGRRVTSVSVIGKVLLHPAKPVVAPPRPPLVPPKPCICDTCRDTNQVRVFDECEACYGKGCEHCDKGLVAHTISCPECDRIKRFGGRRSL